MFKTGKEMRRASTRRRSGAARSRRAPASREDCLMIRFLKALVLLPVAILVVLLAVANRATGDAVARSVLAGPRRSLQHALPLFAVIFARRHGRRRHRRRRGLARAGQAPAREAPLPPRGQSTPLRDRTAESQEAGHRGVAHPALSFRRSERSSPAKRDRRSTWDRRPEPSARPEDTAAAMLVWRRLPTAG